MKSNQSVKEELIYVGIHEIRHSFHRNNVYIYWIKIR